MCNIATLTCTTPLKKYFIGNELYVLSDRNFISSTFQESHTLLVYDLVYCKQVHRYIQDRKAITIVRRITCSNISW